MAKKKKGHPNPKGFKTAQRRSYAVDRRIGGITYQRIADELGITRQSVWDLVTKELDKLNERTAESAQELRRLEVERLDVMLAALWAAVLGGDVFAIDRAIKIQDRRAKLLGLDAKEKYEEPDESEKGSDKVLSSIPAELIAPDFLGMYRAMLSGVYTEFLAKGGRGSTKSSFVSLAIIFLIVNNPDFNALVARNHTNSLRDSVFSQMKWAISMLNLWDHFKASVSPMAIEYLPTGQMIYFRGADKPEKLKGIIPKVGYIGILWLEELDQFRGQEALRNIRQTALRGGDEAYEFLTYNPPKTANNWVNKYSLIPKESRYVHSSDYRNVPPEWLGKPFIDEAEFIKDVNPVAYRHEYLGEVTGTGGLVFDNVETREITDKEIESFDRVYNGADWGYFPDPFSYGRMYYDPARLTLYIFNEYRAHKKSNKKSYEGIKENGYTDSELIVCDSAEPKSIADYLSYGANARGSEKGAGSVDYSMKWLQGLLKIVIDPKRAPHHAIEFTSYELEQDKNGDFITAYPDKDNHAIDDARYALNPIWRRRGL